MRRYADVAFVEPIIDETLSTSELMEILHHRFEARLNGECKDEVAIYRDATYTNWDGTKHEGALVIVYPEGKSENREDYFMERTWNKQYHSAGKVVAKPVWHRLMPVHFRTKSGYKIPTMSSRSVKDMKDFVKLVINNGTIDDVDMGTYDPHASLFSMTREQEFDDTPDNVIAFEKRKKEAYDKLVSGKVPAGDAIWDDLLIGEFKEIRGKVFNALRQRGHFILLDGEKDSFGWVTCGIVMDGNLMTSEYF